MGQKTLRRSKKRFPSARKAWEDIADKTGWEPSDVVKKDHTRTHWRWVIRT